MQIEAALSRIPGSTGRMTLQARVEKVGWVLLHHNYSSIKSVLNCFIPVFNTKRKNVDEMEIVSQIQRLTLCV